MPALGGIRFLTVDPDSAAVKRLQAHIRAAYVDMVEPAIDFFGVNRQMTVAKYDVVAVVNASAPTQWVFLLLKTLIERRDEMTAGASIYRNLDEGRIYREFDVPYHPASVAYYREKTKYRSGS